MAKIVIFVGSVRTDRQGIKVAKLFESKLVERGHNVVCITGRNFKVRVENAGATFHPIPEKWDPRDREIYDFYPELKKKKGLSQIKHYLKHMMFDPVPDVLKILYP